MSPLLTCASDHYLPSCKRKDLRHNQSAAKLAIVVSLESLPLYISLISTNRSSDPPSMAIPRFPFYIGLSVRCTLIGIPARGLASRTNSWKAISPTRVSNFVHSTRGVLFGTATPDPSSAREKSNHRAVSSSIARISSMASPRPMHAREPSSKARQALCSGGGKGEVASHLSGMNWSARGKMIGLMCIVCDAAQIIMFFVG